MWQDIATSRAVIPSESKDNDYNGCAPLRMFFPRPSYETPSMKLGDDARYFVEGAGQVKDHNAQATGL
jgi:hypothetical protein